MFVTFDRTRLEAKRYLPRAKPDEVSTQDEHRATY